MSDPIDWSVMMQAATRRNAAFLAVGAIFLFLLWLVPGRRPPPSRPIGSALTPQPTATVQSQWRPVLKLEGQGPIDLCAEGREVTVPGPWRLRATPADRAVQVSVIDKHDGHLFARVWAGGTEHGSLAALPQGNGTFCLRIEAQGEYTLWVETWEAPEG